MNSTKFPCTLLLAIALLLAMITGCDDRAPSGPSSDGEDAGSRPLTDAGGRIDGSPVDCDNPSAEACDGADNDCDGHTDEGFPIGDACTREMAECSSDGTSS